MFRNINYRGPAIVFLFTAFRYQHNTSFRIIKNAKGNLFTHTKKNILQRFTKGLFAWSRESRTLVHVLYIRKQFIRTEGLKSPKVKNMNGKAY